MKQFFLVVAVVLAATTPAMPQNIAAMVLEEDSGEPIPYASVGVVEQTLGTLTDSTGYFMLNVPFHYDNDTLRISCIGYNPISMPVAEVRRCGSFLLKSCEYLLPEMVVLPVKIKTQTVGRMSNKGSMLIKVDGLKGAGKEMGLQLKTKKRAWIKRVSFAIVECDSMLVRMPFRLNVYKKNSNKYTNNLVSPIEFLYTKDAIVSGRFTFELFTPLMLEKGEYVIAIEFLENFPNHKFLMRTGIMTGQTFYRYAPQTSWKKIPLGSTLAIEVAVEK